MTGPTIYGELMNEATRVSIDQLRENIEGRVSHTAQMLAEELAGIVRQAYIDGVRDGYVQGVAAAEAKQ